MFRGLPEVEIQQKIANWKAGSPSFSISMELTPDASIGSYTDFESNGFAVGRRRSDKINCLGSIRKLVRPPAGQGQNPSGRVRPRPDRMPIKPARTWPHLTWRSGSATGGTGRESVPPRKYPWLFWFTGIRLLIECASKQLDWISLPISGFSNLFYLGSN